MFLCRFKVLTDVFRFRLQSYEKKMIFANFLTEKVHIFAELEFFREKSASPATP